MSKATKVKYVHREVLEDFNLPQHNQKIVKVIASRGNNLHEVVNDTGDKFLVTMPVKFRKNVWVKRNDFVLVEPIREGKKVKAEIVSILYKQQIKYIKEEGLWPNNFYSEDEIRDRNADSIDDEEIFVNTNRVQATYEDSDDDEDTSCDEDNEEDDEDDEEDAVNRDDAEHGSDAKHSS